jgi:hypothetical protein
MVAPPEWLLSIALVAIYIFDSAHFLRIGEAVISTGHGIPKGLSFGSSFELGGRRPFIPNPFTPWRPELRVDWSTSTRAQDASVELMGAQLQQQLREVQPIGWFATACTLFIAVLAPLALVTGQQNLFVINILCCVICAVPACTLVIRRRENLGLSLGQAVSLSVVALVCLPCSGNLARAASVHRRWTVGASELSKLGFNVGRRPMIDNLVRGMLTKVRQLWAEDSAEYQALTSQLKQLEAAAYERH